MTVIQEEKEIPKLRKAFLEAVQKYFPKVEERNLYPDYTGIRPSRAPPEDKEFKDFIISEESAHGFPGLVNLIGIESPGLTASLAIADAVYDCLDQ